MFKNLIIYLVSPEMEHLDLRFYVLTSDLAQRWGALLKKDLPCGIREGERFQGFNEDSKEEIDRGIRKVISLVERLKPLHPEVKFGTLDFSNIQNEVNRLHVNFADRHLLRKDLTEESFQYWNDLNVILHQLEFYLYDKRLKKGNKSSVSRARFTVTFHSHEKQDLTDKDYETAVLNRTFGDIYLTYSQIGRHIESLYWGQDNKIPLKHIQLFRKFSSDFCVYLGPSYDQSYHLYLLNEIKKWFYKEEKHLSQIGLSWDPKRLLHRTTLCSSP